MGSIGEGVGSQRSGDSRDSFDDDQTGQLVVREGGSVEYSHNKQLYRVQLVGGPGVGKTSLCEKFLCPDYVYTYDSLQGPSPEPSVCIMLEDIETELVFLDTPGTDLAVCDCVVIVYSLTDQVSLVTAETILHNLSLARNINNNKAVILVGNKTDLVRARTVPSHDGRSLAISHDCKYVEVSA